MKHAPATGRVMLVEVAADPRLMTLRAAQCLATADWVLADRRVDPRVIEYVSPSAEVDWIDHSPAGRGAEQQESTFRQRIVDSARAGRTVICLESAGATPPYWGPLPAAVSRQAGIPFEVIPGVSAASALAAANLIPITHAEHSSSATLIDAGQFPHPGPGLLRACVDVGGTLIIQLPDDSPSAAAGSWAAGLIDAGQSSATGVAIAIPPADSPTLARGRLEDIPRLLAEHPGEPPSLMIVGDVARADAMVASSRALHRADERPLHGRTVLVCRPLGQAEDLVDRLDRLGARVHLQPAIDITDPPDWSAVDAAIDRLADYDWLVFSSVNGVDYLLGRVREHRGDLRDLAGMRLAAIGPATAARLTEFGLQAQVVPEQYRAEGLAHSLEAEAPGRRFLLARASRGRELLAESLRTAGATVDQVVVYTSRDVPRARNHLIEAMEAGRIDWTLVTSSAIARSLDRQFGPSLRKTRLVSISPVTSETLRELGHEPAAEARAYTMEGVVAALITSARGESSS
jgi:uroporphyrinogen III methyltransferase/synthase